MQRTGSTNVCHKCNFLIITCTHSNTSTFFFFFLWLDLDLNHQPQHPTISTVLITKQPRLVLPSNRAHVHTTSSTFHTYLYTCLLEKVGKYFEHVDRYKSQSWNSHSNSVQKSPCSKFFGVQKKSGKWNVIFFFLSFPSSIQLVNPA